MLLKYYVISLILGLIITIKDTDSAPPKSLNKFSPNLIKVFTEYRKLESKLPKDQLRTITTLGILNGAIEAERDLEQHLTETVADLILNSNMTNSNETLPKIEKIEKMIQRDRSAIHILATAMDYARDTITHTQFRNEMRKTLKDFRKRQNDILLRSTDAMQDRLNALKLEVLEHLKEMQNIIKDKANATVSYLEGLEGLKKARVKRSIEYNSDSNSASDFFGNIFGDQTQHNLVRRQEVMDIPNFDDNTKDKKSEKNEVESTEEKEEEKPGGLVGLIASLSGGEEGSDIGALVGALTGVVAQLFGPNGLDIPSLISSGTSLIAGLLSGGRNFGTVLGEYVGLAVDGLSGGGGAINNGQFFGNLLGTIFAELSADPEDDDEPPKPQIFIDNFLNSFVQAKSKKGEDDKDKDKDKYEEDDDKDKDKDKEKDKGSDSFGFIKHILKAAIGGVTSFVLNASLGSSGGSSQGSAKLSAGSADSSSGSSSKGSEHDYGGHKYY